MTRLSKNVLAFLIAFALTFAFATAFATGSKKDPTQQQNQHQGQKQYQGQQQAQKQTTDVYQGNTQTVETASAASATNDGNSLSVESHYESGPADAVLVPNNNTEGCLRVFGFMYGDKNGTGMLGWPFRSKQCDFEQAADDAAAYGQHELAWFWRCNKKNLYRRFRDKGESRDKAIADCHAQMVGPINLQRKLDAANDQLTFIENERKIEREHFLNQREQSKADCAEALHRQHENCMSK